ncbi:hypothetical protein [Phycobacter sp. K97]|uniref:hypothetical protein n=1 Tax=Phycobacter sedimenti TaxID=3133977 RepID=UPI0031202CA2
MGCLASTSFGGSKALAKTELSPLAERTVIIWSDLDEPGQHYASHLAPDLVTIHKATPLILPITEDLAQTHDRAGELPMPLPKGWDVRDAIAAGWRRREADALVNDTLCDLPDATAPYLTLDAGTAAHSADAPTYR